LVLFAFFCCQQQQDVMMKSHVFLPSPHPLVRVPFQHKACGFFNHLHLSTPLKKMLPFSHPSLHAHGLLYTDIYLLPTATTAVLTINTSRAQQLFFRRVCA
jgi:hypothetical protein